MATTPMLYFATRLMDTGAGIAVTGSHNPPNHNGFKLVLDGASLYGDGIAALRDAMRRPIEGAAHAGGRTQMQMQPCYAARVMGDIRLTRPMKIAVDCGNGVAGAIAPSLFRALGCEVTELFCEVDGAFPGHHPDPADPQNLQDLIYCLRYSDCEIGLAFDGDGDRLGVVSKSGQIIWPDRQLILFARDVLSRNPGAEIIYDVKCSRHVARAITEAGGKATMWKTGHSLIKAKMRETGALLAGEMSGHLFFGTLVRLRRRVVRRRAPAGNPVRGVGSLGHAGGLPQSCATPEIKLETAEGEQFALVELRAQGGFPGAQSINDLDGVRWIMSTASAWRGRPTPRRRSCCVSKGTRWPPWRASRRTSATPCVASRLMSVYRSKEHYAMDRAEFAREEAQAAGLPDCAEWRAFDHAARCAELDAGALADRGGGPEPGLVHAASVARAGGGGLACCAPAACRGRCRRCSRARR